ncbi:hypothetical protein ONZ45_g19096 [Pleurotus djamor]|nr:hypothetical protein ONZ45_g19096 [Pleurotus djamor]
MESLLDWTSVNHILQAISKHETPLSFHLHAIHRLHLSSTEVIQLVSSLSFLGHLDVDTFLFMNLRAMKQFICSFPCLHTLEVKDEFREDSRAGWYDEQASAQSLDFPSTIRNLSFHPTKRRTLEALLQWLLLHTSTLPRIERFSIQIRDEHNLELLRALLRSLGAGLTSLSLDYRWEPGQPTIDLKANTNLRYLFLSLTLCIFDEYDENMKEQISATLGSLASPLLQTVDFELKLRLQTMIGYPEYDFVDWGALGEAARGAELRISLSCLRKEEVEGIQQRINVNRQMAQHRAQGKLQCRVITPYL